MISPEDRGGDGLGSSDRVRSRLVKSDDADRRGKPGEGAPDPASFGGDGGKLQLARTCTSLTSTSASARSTVPIDTPIPKDTVLRRLACAFRLARRDKGISMIDAGLDRKPGRAVRGERGDVGTGGGSMAPLTSFGPTERGDGTESTGRRGGVGAAQKGSGLSVNVVSCRCSANMSSSSGMA